MVCLGNQGLWCSTCTKPSCKHTSHLQKVCKDTNEEMSPRLKMFADYQVPHPELKKRSYLPRVLSKSMIPFVLPLHLKNRMKEDYSHRFNLCSGVANLIPCLPPSPSLCSLCDSVDNWSGEVYLEEESFLVTPQCCYIAKGIRHIIMVLGLSACSAVFMRKCSSNNCMAKLSYDGKDDCVLSMGIFSIAHEVLRNHMFHFFHGR